MTVAVITTDVAAAPPEVFALLTDLPGYGSWLPVSKTYLATFDISDTPLRAGSTYTDRISGDLMHGEVLELVQDELVVFHQHNEGSRIAVTIRYALEATSTGTRVTRTGDIRTSGRMRLLHPIVVLVTRRENERTIAALAEHFSG